MKLDIETLLPWTAGKPVQTRNGERILRTAPATEAFWSVWRANKESLKAAGLSCAPVNGDKKDWVVNWWQPLDPTETARREVLRAASRATDANVILPCPDGLNYLGFQKAGIKFCLERFGDECTGSTATERFDCSEGVTGKVQDVGARQDVENESQRGGKGTDARPGDPATALGRVETRQGQTRRQFPRGKRPPTGPTGGNAESGFETARYDSGISSQDARARNWAERTDELQSGLRQPDSEDCAGSGRSESLPDGAATTGRKKANRSGIVGLDRASDQISAGVLIADEQGLGKTIQAIGIINCISSIRRVVVVCPATLKVNWKRELTRWLTRPLRVGIQNSDCAWIGDRVDVVVINYDCLHKFDKQLQAVEWDLRIVDEAHYAKNPKARRTKNTYAIPARRKASLTGTPILNKPVEIFPIINDLDPRTWSNFFGFAKRYCAAKQISIGRGRSAWDFTGSSNEGELQDRLRSTIMVRRLKSEVLTELPAKRRAVIELDADGCEKIINAEMEAWRMREGKIAALRAAVELAKASDDRADYESAVDALRDGQAAAFAEMAKLRHATALAKLPQVIEFVKDSLENGKVILFVHHLDAVAGLKAAFPQAAVVTGGFSSEQKMAEVDRFQKDAACDLFIGNDAAAEGITLTASSHVVFGEGDWVPGKLSQKEDRAHRIGQRNSVLVSHLVLEGSLDAVMIKRCIAKQEVIDACLDDAGKAAAARDAAVNGPVEVVTEIEATDPQEPKEGTRMTFETVAKEAATVPPEIVALALEGMRMLAGCCDGARKLDGSGFSKVDAYIGHSFAGQLHLSQKQAVIARRLVVKYKRQLPRSVVEPMYRSIGKEMPE